MGVNTNLFLMENTLKSSFCIIATLVNANNEEREINFRKKFKDFIRENYAGTTRVVLVDKYPPTPMDMNVFYIKRNGKILWVKTSSRNFNKTDKTFSF